jgi:hypothetical protein
MAAIAYTIDLTWLWVLLGVGAFLTVIATFVYAMTTQPRRPRQLRPDSGQLPDGSHERLDPGQTADSLRAAA